MKTTIKEINQKQKLNDGENFRIKRRILILSEIRVGICGCGGVPKIIRKQSGQVFSTYNGDNFCIKCPCCGIRTGDHLNVYYYNENQYNKEVIKLVTKLIRIWNKAIRAKITTEIEFSTL